MYSDSQQLGDWKTALKKVRDTVHKIFPRELSPSRMLEKYASDTKKKTAARGAAVVSKSAAANAAADTALQKKLDALTATIVPGGSALAFTSPPQNTSASAPASDPPYLALGLGAGALVLLWFMASRVKK